MGKYERKKTGKRTPAPTGKKAKKSSPLTPALVALGVVALAAFVMFVMPQLLYRLSNQPEETEPAVQTDPGPAQTTQAPEQTTAAPTQSDAPAVAFPLAIDEGRLEIDSLFRFDGINPDSQNQEGKDIASIVLKNTSGAYLEKAQITLTLSDGSALHFLATDLPAGKSAMVFDADNRSVSDNVHCIGVSIDPAYGDITAPDGVSASVSGMNITVTNGTDKTISQVVLFCRSPYGEHYFGGITYQYIINNLPAGESADVMAADCILGTAEVVRIAINEE